MKKKERKQKSSVQGICVLILLPTLVLWLLCMFLVTWMAAADMYHQLETAAAEIVSLRENYADPDYTTYRMLSTQGSLYNTHLEPLGFFMMKQRPSYIDSDHWLWGNWELIYGFESAMLVCGTTNEETPYNFRLGDSDYLYFPYMDKMHYITLPQSPTGYGYIDLNTLPEGQNDFIDYINNWSVADGHANVIHTDDFRMTGWFEDGQFHPVTIDIWAVEYGETTQWRKWKSLLELPNDADRELTEIYTTFVERIGMPQRAFSVDGMTFDSLTDMLSARLSLGNYNSNNLFHAVITQSYLHETVFGEYVKAVAFRCCPVGYAALRLIPFYLITLGIVLLLVRVVSHSIRKNLAKPLEGIMDAVLYHAPLKPGSKWKDIYCLEEQYLLLQQSLSEKSTELQQLRTKLYYTQNAEENRRQLVSGLTHELKTPLAVIHSYAEGLQEGIAKDKEDHYLSVILEQSEKMDSLVLQMLDLSRLEAGKVRLSTDNFSLLELTKSVVERFAPMLEAKALTVNFAIAQDFLITADQARMEQVITNLVSNALKYTEPENQINISVFQHLDKAGFSIENPGKWLSDEDLEKVWDSFFRVDPSRTQPGTGLGLAVVKQIIQLHQGSCKARNMLYKKNGDTFTGVQFSFQIPMG